MSNECKILGKIIGTFEDWDEMDNLALVFYKFKPNELGRKFIRNIELEADIKYDLDINFDSGSVQLDKELATKEIDGIIGTESINVVPDWSVFNG